MINWEIHLYIIEVKCIFCFTVLIHIIIADNSGYIYIYIYIYMVILSF